MEFVPKRPMRAKQQEAFDKSKDMRHFALLMKMRTGKSKVIIDNALYLYNMGRINALVIVAPNGVHTKWVKEDVPKDIPEYIDIRTAVWHSGDKHSAEQCEKLLTPGQQFRLLAMNIEAFSRDGSDAEKLLSRFLNATDAMLCVDESHFIKNPDSKRTKRLMKLSNKAAYKRIATGTSTANGVFDLYAQFSFLDEDIFGQSFLSFKHQYGHLLPDDHPTMRAIKARGARFLPAILEKDGEGRPKYKNLDQLKKIIHPYSFTCTLEECTDLPPTVYEKVFYQMTDKQQKVYDELKKTARVEFEDASVTVLHKLTQMLRLQQVLSGFLPADDEDRMVPLFKTAEDNPRVKALFNVLETLEDEGEQAIIWCRFVSEIKMLEQLLGDKAFVIYGAVKNREELKDRFMAKERPFMIANVAIGGTGLDYSGIYAMVYFSNDFNFGNRDQSEARPLHVGQQKSLLIVDLEAENTIDQIIVNAMQNKRSVSVEMMKF